MRYLIAALILAGCVSPQEAAYRDQLQAELAREAYRQRLASQCQAYGFRPNSQEFSQCLLQLDQSAQNRDANLRLMILQQAIQQQTPQQILPPCSQYPAGIQGFQRSQGNCR